MKSVFVVFAALCLATFALADPTKPQPPTEFSLSAFAITPNGYASVRTYYDQANQRTRTDVFDNNFSQVGEIIAQYQEHRAFFYDSQSGSCLTLDLSSPWTNAWDFLNDAVYLSSDEYYPGKTCDLWITEFAPEVVLGACFSGNELVFLGSYNGTSVESLYFITSFESSVDPNVFSAPSTCNSFHPYKLSSSLPAMKLKKFKVPAHPLLF